MKNIPPDETRKKVADWWGSQEGKKKVTVFEIYRLSHDDLIRESRLSGFESLLKPAAPPDEK